VPELQAALEALGLAVRAGEPIARHGFWRIGGPGDLLVDVPDAATLARVRALGTPILVLGKGSNLLVSDRGVRGITVVLGGAFRSSSIEGDLVEAGAGLPNAVLLQRLQKLGVGGLGALAGVPGTLGGAIRMNAGTRLGEISERVHEVELLLADGRLERVAASALQFGYRKAILPPDAIVTRVWLRISAEGVETERAAIAEHLAYRKATQPLELPSCGSVFKNPPGDSAGRLVEAAGLKGTVAGDAQISDLHANFIVNRGAASAADVVALVCLARDTVRDRFSIALEPEVHVAGDWASPPF
jgi:UDP-N-acetylmuramate dehydrogenase